MAFVVWQSPIAGHDSLNKRQCSKPVGNLKRAEILRNDQAACTSGKYYMMTNKTKLIAREYDS